MYHNGGFPCASWELLLLSVVVEKCCETVSLPNADCRELSEVSFADCRELSGVVAVV